MVLRPIDIDGLRRVATVPSLPSAPEITLAAAAELACACASGGRSPLAEHAELWFGHLKAWTDMMAWLVAGERPDPQPDWSAPTFEMWPIHDARDVTSDAWLLFQDRFRRTATQHGFTTQLGAALSMALGEMSDNVFQHSAGARGFAAFQFASKRVAWCVADLGQGVLSSLRQNPRWSSLQTSEAALLSVWRENATSRSEFANGTGFRQVDRSLAALNGRLRIRTGDAVLELSGTSGSLRPAMRTNPFLCGLQIAANCALDRPGDLSLSA